MGNCQGKPKKPTVRGSSREKSEHASMYSFLKFKVKPSGTPTTEEVTLKKENETAAQTSVVMVEKGGIGLVDPGRAVDLYEGMHSFLAKAGITGVKVDVIHGKKGVWLKLPVERSELVPVAVKSEEIFEGAVREVKEETGIDTEFVDLISFRHAHGVAFGKSDLFFVCMLRPLSTQIVVDGLEIQVAKMAYKVAQRLVCLKYSNQDEDGVWQALQSLKESYKEGRLNS